MNSISGARDFSDLCTVLRRIIMGEKCENQDQKTVWKLPRLFYEGSPSASEVEESFWPELLDRISLGFPVGVEEVRDVGRGHYDMALFQHVAVDLDVFHDLSDDVEHHTQSEGFGVNGK